MRVGLDELAGHWTLLDDERELIAGKRGPTRLGFPVLLKFYTRAGRFPRGRAEPNDETAAFVARQVGVPASDLGFYEWAGSTIEKSGGGAAMTKPSGAIAAAQYGAAWAPPQRPRSTSTRQEFAHWGRQVDFAGSTLPGIIVRWNFTPNGFCSVDSAQPLG